MEDRCLIYSRAGVNVHAIRDSDKMKVTVPHSTLGDLNLKRTYSGGMKMKHKVKNRKNCL